MKIVKYGVFGTPAVVAIDTETQRVAATIPVGAQPSDIATTPNAPYAFVANFGSDSLSIIDVRLDTVVATLASDERAAQGPVAIAIDRNGRGCVANVYSRSLNFFSTRGSQTMSAPVFLRNVEPDAVAFAADGRTLYVADGAGNQVRVYDARATTLQKIVTVGNVPTALALTPDGSAVYVANFGSDTVSVIHADSNVRAATIPVGRMPIGLAVAEVPVTCAGDCDADGRVTVPEILLGVAIALGNSLSGTCDALDGDRNGAITIDELVRAMNDALQGCGAPRG
jgi:YVTN family beta-propeller protein